MEDILLKTNPLISREAVAALHEDLFRWCLSRCGYDRETAEDLMQQTYVEVISGRARFGGNSSLKTFLFGVAQNLTRTHFRKAAARARFAERNAALDGSDVRQSDAGAAMDEMATDHSRLWQSVRELSDRQRDVIELVFCSDLTIEEAAGVMQVSIGTARQHYSRAKASLAHKLGGLRSELLDDMTVCGDDDER